MATLGDVLIVAGEDACHAKPDSISGQEDSGVVLSTGHSRSTFGLQLDPSNNSDMRRI